MNDGNIIAFLAFGATPNEIATTNGEWDRTIFNRAVQLSRELSPRPCTHGERSLGVNGWTCVMCGDTVEHLPAGERPYDTNGDF